MPTKPILNDQDVQRIIALKNQGLSFETIADQFFVHKHTISSALKRRGIKIPKGQKGLSQQEIDRIKILKSQGLSGNSIAKRIGVNRYTVNRVIDGSYRTNHIQSGYDSPLD